MSLLIKNGTIITAAVRPTKSAELRSLTQGLCQPTPPGFSW